MASTVLGFFSPMAHPVRNGLYLNGQKLSLSEGLMFTLGGGTWLGGSAQCCVRLKNEIKADFYSRGRTSVVLICEFSSKKNFSSMHDAGCLGLVHWDDPEEKKIKQLVKQKNK